MKYYVDEPDCGNFNAPLVGVTSNTKLFDSREEAEKEVERLSNTTEVAFCVWEIEVDK